MARPAARALRPAALLKAKVAGRTHSGARAARVPDDCHVKRLRQLRGREEARKDGGTALHWRHQSANVGGSLRFFPCACCGSLRSLSACTVVKVALVCFLASVPYPVNDAEQAEGEPDE